MFWTRAVRSGNSIRMPEAIDLVTRRHIDLLRVSSACC
ncbi:putative leader peptide [Carbonactinospora thermoautotrophica]